MTGFGEAQIRAAAYSMANPTLRKIKILRAKLTGHGKTIVAFSGGVDSSLVAKVAKDELDRDALAVIAVSPTLPKVELEAARQTAKMIGIKLLEVTHDELAVGEITRNDEKRCYFCKGALAAALSKVAKEQGYVRIVDGVNFSDTKEYRPGIAAATEAGIDHPLAEIEATKEEVRAMAKLIGLLNWDKPAAACLSSRIPFGTTITAELLARVEGAEAHLRSLGFRQVRVRTDGTRGSIEVDADQVALLQQLSAAGNVVAPLERLGYTEVAIDEKGYRPGSLVPVALRGTP